MRKQREMLFNLQWQILVVLDACRYDYFQQCNTIQGTLHKVESPASTTQQWLRRVFPDYYRMVYCSANPYIYYWRQHFWKVDPVYDWGWETVQGIETVPPWNIVKSVHRHQDEHTPLIAHFMQPHPPYIGDTTLDIAKFTSSRKQVLQDMGRKPKGPDSKPLHQHPKLEQAYQDNLKLALQYVKKLVNHTHRKMIVTSDHGELLGEDGLYSHTHGEHPKLRHIPLLEVKK